MGAKKVRDIRREEKYRREVAERVCLFCVCVCVCVLVCLCACFIFDKSFH